ncbi:MAG TPA: EAL domain-containing protein [Gammaproteobacteria bacterium]|nr:EAL domain-containing protein [Gammaproteobacteria bacterium]
MSSTGQNNCRRIQAHYAALGDIGGLVARSPDVPDLLQAACELVVEHTGSTATYIATVADEGGNPAVALGAVAGPSGDYVRGLELSLRPDRPGGNGMVGRVYRAGTALASNDCLNDPRFGHMVDALAAWDIRAAVGLPILVDSESRGVLVVAAGQAGYYDETLRHLLERIAEILATGIDRAEERARSARYQILYRVQSEVNALIARGPEPQHLYDETCRIVAAASDELRAYMALVEPGAERLRFVSCAGAGLDARMARTMMGNPVSTRGDDPTGRGIAGTTYRARRLVVWPDVHPEAETALRSKLRRQTGTRSLMGIPVFLHGACRAVLVLASSISRYFDEGLIEVSKQLASSLNVALNAHEKRQALRAMALTDGLTGLPNRTLFADRLRMATARVDRNGGQLAIALIDLDNLKEVNARLGHSAGDLVIRAVAERIESVLRRSDTVARFGGDEFAAIFHVRSAQAALEVLLSRILEVVEQPLEVDAENVTVRASIGVALYPRDGAAGEDLLRRADLAMARVKSQGGNSWSVFEQALERQVWDRHWLKGRFSEALERGEIRFHYQPIIELLSGRVVGAEALARWHDPERGVLGPGEWIEVVENNARLVTDLGRHALHSAMRQLRAWEEQGSRLSLSVNIGARHLLASGFLDDLREALAIAPDLAPRLVLEVTETALIDDFRKVARVLAECRRLGARVALDDFGTGQASLTYLLELPANRLKIDHSFVLRMLSDFRAFGIVAGAVQGTRMLGMNAVAEGVETEEHGLRLLQLGCRYAQGFAIARAMPADEFGQWAASWTPPEAWRRSVAMPLGQEHVQLLASLVLHRARHWTMVGELRDIGDDRRSLSPETWSSYCPVNLEARAARRHLRENNLTVLHRELHGLERSCFETLGESGRIPSDLLRRARHALQDYEFGVDELLSGRHRESGR